MTAGDTVPAQAGAVVSIDVEAMLNDDDLMDIANTGLDQLRELPGENDVPEDVDSAIDSDYCRSVPGRPHD